MHAVDDQPPTPVVIVTSDLVVGDVLVAAGRRRGLEVSQSPVPPVSEDVVVVDFRHAGAVPASSLDDFFTKISMRTRPPTVGKNLVDEGPSALTPRELELCRNLLAGHGTVELARRLGISERTVGTHLRNIFAKLGMTSRAQLIAWAGEAGLTSEGEA
jgi:DNA-binding CsgD family transcriptional regulator